MNNKHDKTMPLMTHLQPEVTSQTPEIILEPAFVDIQSALSVLELFKLRLNNWLPTNNEAGEKYSLEQLFNQFLTVHDLKKNIGNLNDLSQVLTHPKMSIQNRYLLLNTLAAIFPHCSNVQTNIDPYCDDVFMKLLVKNNTDFMSILNLISDSHNKNFSTMFLTWVENNSPYLRNFSGYTTQSYLPRHFYSIQGQMNFSSRVSVVAQPPHPFIQPDRQLVTQETEYDDVLNTFIQRLLKLDQKELCSYTLFKGKLFDNNLSVIRLRDNILNISDIVYIFEKGKLPPKGCYSLFNYLISLFPIKECNRNLKNHPCDNTFLQKIIKKREDIEVIYNFIRKYGTADLSEILEGRLLLSPYCAKLLKTGDVLSQTTPCFFAPQNEKNSLPQSIFINLVDSEENNEFASNKSPKVRRDSEIINIRPSKRRKENTENTALSAGEKQITTDAKPKTNNTSQHPLGLLTQFFAQPAPVHQITEEPQGGEYEYIYDEHGKKIGILE